MSLNPSTPYYQIREGPQGRPGKPGKQGDPGPRGYQGISGATGCTGPQGDSVIGPTGDKGDVGPQGEPSGFTGPTGQAGQVGSIGPTGEKGTDGLIQVYYQESSVYGIKWMSTRIEVTPRPLHHVGASIAYTPTLAGVWFLISGASIDKYIRDIHVHKILYQVVLTLQLSHAAKWVHAFSLGKELSIPIYSSNVDFISDTEIKITFDFDSLLAFDEYIYASAIYTICIQWY